MLLLIPISSTVRFVVDRVAKLVLFVSVAEADDSTPPTIRISLLFPLLLPPLVLRSSLPNSCGTDGCWFSSISLFVMITKSKQLHYLFWGILTIYDSRSNALATGWFYCLSELTAWQVWVSESNFRFDQRVKTWYRHKYKYKI